MFYRANVPFLLSLVATHLPHYASEHLLGSSLMSVHRTLHKFSFSALGHGIALSPYVPRRLSVAAQLFTHLCYPISPTIPLTVGPSHGNCFTLLALHVFPRNLGAKALFHAVVCAHIHKIMNPHKRARMLVFRSHPCEGEKNVICRNACSLRWCFAPCMQNLLPS